MQARAVEHVAVPMIVAPLQALAPLQIAFNNSAQKQASLSLHVAVPVILASSQALGAEHVASPVTCKWSQALSAPRCTWRSR